MLYNFAPEGKYFALLGDSLNTILNKPHKLKLLLNSLSLRSIEGLFLDSLFFRDIDISRMILNEVISSEKLTLANITTLLAKGFKNCIEFKNLSNAKKYLDSIQFAKDYNLVQEMLFHPLTDIFSSFKKYPLELQNEIKSLFKICDFNKVLYRLAYHTISLLEIVKMFQGDLSIIRKILNDISDQTVRNNFILDVICYVNDEVNNPNLTPKYITDLLSLCFIHSSDPINLSSFTNGIIKEYVIEDVKTELTAFNHSKASFNKNLEANDLVLYNLPSSSKEFPTACKEIYANLSQSYNLISCLSMVNRNFIFSNLGNDIKTNIIAFACGIQNNFLSSTCIEKIVDIFYNRNLLAIKDVSSKGSIIEKWSNLYKELCNSLVLQKSNILQDNIISTPQIER